MKVLLVVVLALLAATNAEKPLTLLSVEETTGYYYHNRIGEPEAKRIQAEEENLAEDPSRIVGGSAAGLGQHPWLGGIVITLTTGGTSVCGSSLVTNTRAVTAAHCWWDGSSLARQFVVVFGSTFLFSGGTRITTTNVRMHASWNPNNLNNDVAIITLQWVTFTNTIRNIALATGTNTFVGQWAWAAGFGRQSDSAGIGNNQAQHHIQLQVITNAVAQQTFGNIIIASTLCTSGAGGRGTCGGDSGGPLAIGTTLIGITSFGSSAGCQRGFPSCFARVTNFASWLYT